MSGYTAVSIRSLGNYCPITRLVTNNFKINICLYTEQYQFYNAIKKEIPQSGNSANAIILSQKHDNKIPDPKSVSAHNLDSCYQ